MQLITWRCYQEVGVRDSDQKKLIWLCCEFSDEYWCSREQQDLTDGVLLGGELQGASREGAVEVDVVDAARRVGEEWQGVEAIGREAAVAGVEHGAEGTLEEEHHRRRDQSEGDDEEERGGRRRTWAVVGVEGGDGEVSGGDAQRRCGRAGGSSGA
jgi:hypothetical protein